MHEVLLIDRTDPGSSKHRLNDNGSLLWFLLSGKDFFSQNTHKAKVPTVAWLPGMIKPLTQNPGN